MDMAREAEQTNINGSLNKKKLQRVAFQPENPFALLRPNQETAIIPSFTLESGIVLYNVPIAYSTLGSLSPSRDNVIVICHALTGSADVNDWWGPLIGGKGRAFDLTRFYVICLNGLGSPYGSASPLTYKNGDPGQGRYGHEFPLTTIRDDVSIHQLVLDDLGVRQIAAVVGGSMGGMLVLEYAYFGKDYVRTIVPIATSARHSAWGISWGEAQRQTIYCDLKFNDGYYPLDDPPTTGLGAARMSALLTYRSRDSFESRFGRNACDRSMEQKIDKPRLKYWPLLDDSQRLVRRLGGNTTPPLDGCPPATSEIAPTFTDAQFQGPTTFTPPPTPSPERQQLPADFSAQSYLRYQGEKFIKRFDSNCYIALTRKLDTHDVSRHRIPPEDDPQAVAKALSQISQPTLVLGIESDGLFTFKEQQELAAAIPNSILRTIDSSDGHDAFLIESEQVNDHLLKFFRRSLPDLMENVDIEKTNPKGVDRGGGPGSVQNGIVNQKSAFSETNVKWSSVVVP